MSNKTNSAAMSAAASRELQLEDLMLWIKAPDRGFVASPVAIYSVLFESGGSAQVRPIPVVRLLTDARLHLAGVDSALVHELAILDPLDGELREGGVAVIVEAPGAENALVV